ncbi:MAG: family 20 glycosylhydrolase, partial [Clostridia bacterium]|nr:family 20 glycosylhydrolase [Clostridia bacterium]
MEKLNLKRFGSLIDCSRNAVMNMKSLKEWIDMIADLGFNSLMVYTEDTYEVNGHPYFGYARGRYSKSEMKEMDAYARSRGVELIPYIQTLAHIEMIFRWKDYAPIHDCDDILLCDDERTYELIDSMFETLRECFSTHVVNVGMDEAKNMGRGK